MKIKSYIACGALLLSVGAATTSCEDMFTAENNLVTTDLTPQDTVYQVMGIVQRMQKLADRTVLLGEVRADLVDVNATVASTDLQQLKLNAIDEQNVYNKPADYYAVINNCNIYLAGVDSLLMSHGERYYEKEICAVKCFRAWCYLELAKIYGEVPFVTDPVLTADAAEQIVADGKSKANMAAILDYCIDDLKGYPYMDENLSLRPKYGNQTYAGFTFDNFFIPVRALLAELYLWRGTYTQNEADFINAIRMYHNYFVFPGEERSAGQYSSSATSYANVYWMRNSPSSNQSTSGMYGMGTFINMNGTYQNTCIVPLDTTTYAGNVSDIRTVFNSQYANNYYAWVEPSQRLRNISAGQDYCYYNYTDDNNKDTLIFSKDPNEYPEGNSIYVGDLRLSDVYHTYSNLTEAQYNAGVNASKSFVAKYTGGSNQLSNDKRIEAIPLFRNNILYLHFAEALNRAGFPETAFAVLAYGLSYDVMTDRSIISWDEFERLSAIKCYGFSINDTYYTGDLSIGNNSVACWNHEIFGRENKDVSKMGNGMSGFAPGSAASHMQIGIHSLGSGDTEYNPSYRLDNAETLANLKKLINPVAPTEPVWKKSDKDSTIYKQEMAIYEEGMRMYEEDLKKDSVTTAENAAYLKSPEVRAVRMAHVAELILDEEALEGMFEGTRFYDLMRYQMYAGAIAGKDATITLPAYIEEQYGNLKDDKMTGRPWYLPLPRR